MKCKTRLAQIWQETLEAEKIGINDNFFNLGGDSIKAISLISKMNRELAAGIAIKDIYMYPTDQGTLNIYWRHRSQGLDEDLKNGLAEIENI